VVFGEQYFSGAITASPNPQATWDFSRGAPSLTNNDAQDISAIHKLPKGALVASPPRNVVSFNSGRLPAQSTRDVEAMNEVQTILATGSTRAVNKSFPAKFIYCHTGISEPCAKLYDKVTAAQLDPIYKRTGSDGTAFIIKTNAPELKVAIPRG
jgi:hypothetical protein